jgi:hypothetical protein
MLTTSTDGTKKNPPKYVKQKERQPAIQTKKQELKQNLYHQTPAGRRAQMSSVYTTYYILPLEIVLANARFRMIPIIVTPKPRKTKISET